MNFKAIKLLFFPVALIFTLAVLGSCTLPTNPPSGDGADHTHAYGEWSITTDPTCTVPGEQVRKCACGATETESIDPPGHSYSEWTMIKKATCTSGGEKVRECDCGATDSRAIPMRDHDYGAWEIVSYPTCTAAGEQVRECECGAIDREFLGVLPHSFGNWTVVSSPDCTNTGLETRTCTCGATESNIIPAKQHSFGDWTTLCESTCSIAGERVRKCECGETESEKLDTLPHQTVTVVGYAADCTTDGLTDGIYCSVCKTVISVQTVIPAYGHTEHTVEGYPPTCTASGVTDSKYCLECGVTTVPAVTIPSTGHSEVRDEGREATCTTDGLTDGAHCTTCGTVTVEQIYIPSPGHSFESFGLSATCQSAGTETLQCRVCGMTETKYSARLPHDYEDGNCTACGETSIDYFDFIYYGEDMFTGRTHYHAVARDVSDFPANVVIPRTYEDGYVESFSIENCDSIVSLYATDYVVRFYLSGCDSLETLILDDSVVTNVSSSIEDCPRIRSIRLPRTTVYLELTELSSLTELSFADGCAPRNIVLRGCSGIERLDLPDSLTEIEAYSFKDCSSLRELDLPSGLISIGYEAFMGCSSLSSVTLPDTLESLGAGAFSGCTSLETVRMSPLLTVIPDSAFYGCTSLTSLDIPEGVVTVGGGAFDSCSSLCSIILPSMLTYIGDSAFRGTAITEIAIPASLHTLGYAVFAGCEQLARVDFSEDSAITVISESLFNGCKALKSLTLPASIVEIASYAIIGSGIETVEWSGTPRELLLHSFAFASSTSLVTVRFPETALTLGENIFRYSSLRNITIPEGVTEIPLEMFFHCDSLERITFPSTLRVIGESAFEFCKSLSDLELPGGLLTVGRAAFASCYSIEHIIIPDTVTLIDAYAFSSCNAIRTLVIPESVETVGKDAFYHSENSGYVYCRRTTAPEGFDPDWAIGRTVVWGYTCEKPYGHEYQPTVVPPTCTEWGYTYYTCECGDRYDGPTTELPLDHARVTLTTPPTCISEGREYVSCERCDYTEERLLDYLPHSYEGASCITCGATHESLFGYWNLDNEGLTCSLYLYDGFAYPERIVIPAVYNGMRVLRVETFNTVSDSSGVREIVIPEGVTHVSRYCFENYGSLTSLYLPVSVTTLSYSFIYGCTSLESIVYGGTLAEWEAVTKEEGWCAGITSFTVVCKDGTRVVDCLA